MKRTNLLLIMSLIVTITFAIPARKTPFTVTQPDGTKVTLRLHGDENFSYRTTTDGWVVQKNENGYYVYCIQNDQGRPVATSIAARNPEDRSQNEIEQLTLLSAKSSAIKAIRKAQAQRKPIKQIAKKSQALGQKGIVILAQYSDVKFTIPNFATEYNNMLNQTDYSNSYGQKGSAKDYFVDNSRGKYAPSFTVIGPVTLPNNRAYYGGNDKDGNDLRPATQIVDAIAKANFSGINLSEYDSDNDGYVDLVYVVYAGEGEAYSTAPESSVWQHAWSLESAKYFQEISTVPTLQGKKFDYYACSSELSSSQMDGIGTFCHEFCHTLGLPDLYDVDYEDNGQSYGVNSWSIMASGADFNDGYSPIGLTAYERDFLSWGKLTELTDPNNYTLYSLWKTGKGYKITSSKKPNEYFILENRQRDGWDAVAPAEGMLIYHVEYDQTVWDNNEINMYANHPRFRVVPADNNESTTTNGVAGDVFPGSKNNTEFSNTSTPASKLWDNSYLDKPITEIKLIDGLITFDFMGGKRIATPQNAFVGASSLSATLFSWGRVEGATSYLVNVYSQKTVSGAPISVTEPFKGGGILSLNDWTTSATSGYSSSGNYGKASPSLKLDASNKHITTPLYTTDITAFSFWLKWQGAVSSKLQIKGLVNGSWTVLTELPTSTPNGTYTLKSIPEGVRQLSIVYIKSVGNVAVDDVTVTTSGTAIEKTYLAGHQDKEIAETQLIVEGIEPLKEYFYTVRAKDATTESIASNAIAYTINPTAVNETNEAFKVYANSNRQIVIIHPQPNNKTLTLYNTLGQRITTQSLKTKTTELTVPQSGTYIVEIGTYRNKVIVR